MRFFDSLLAVAVSALVVAPLCAMQAGHRTINYVTGMTIAEQLLPSDQVVRVQRLNDYNVFDSEPRPEDVLQELLENDYGTAAVVDVARVQGALVEDGRWIRTLFEGTVVEILGSASDAGSQKSLSKGGVVAFSSDGGALKIGKVLVETDGSISYPENRRYLVFLGKRYHDADHRMLGTDPLMVQGTRRVAVPGSQTKLAGLRLEDARRAARRVKR